MEYYITVAVFFLFGMAGGFLGGMLGVGGGIIFVPILTHFTRALGIEGDVLVKCVLANSMMTIVFTGLAASYNQYKLGSYYLKPVLYTAFAGVFSSLFVTYLITSGSWYNKQRFSIFFISLLIFVSVRAFVKRKYFAQNIPLEQISPVKFSLTGFGAGIVTALSGLGGGLIMVPAFSLILKLDIKKSISISTGVIIFFALPLTILYIIKQPAVFPESVFHIGHIIPQMVVPMGAGVIIASKLGVRTGTKMKEAKLRLLLMLLISSVTIKMLIEMFVHS